MSRAAAIALSLTLALFASRGAGAAEEVEPIRFGGSGATMIHPDGDWSHEPPDSKWLRAEDRCDGLQDLGQRVAAYQALRRQLLARGSAEGPRVSTGVKKRPVQLRRVEAKLALTIRRRATPEPSLHEARQMAREAAQIGMLHLEQNDPERARRYEAQVEALEPSSPATSKLRNAVRAWFQARLDAILESLDDTRWEHARKHVARWQRVLPRDASVPIGRLQYARERAEVILASHGPAKAEEALEQLELEREFLPTEQAWEHARDRVRQNLITDVRGAKQDLDPERMRETIERLERLFPGETELGDLYGGYRDLVISMQPELIERDNGFVRNATIQLGGDVYLGPSRVRTDDQVVSQDFDSGVTMRGEWRWLFERHFEDNFATDLAATDTLRPWYLGAAVTGSWVESATDLDSASAWIARLELLLGRRFSNGTISLGVGPAMQFYELDYDEFSTKINETAFGPSYCLNVDWKLSRTWAFFGNGAFNRSGGFNYLVLQTGARYHPDPRVAFRFGAFLLDSTIARDENDPDSHEVSASGGGVAFGMNFQF